MRRPLLVGISAALLLVGLFAATCGGNGDDGGATTTTPAATTPADSSGGTDLVAQGKAIYTGKGLCITCHANENIPGAVLELGPDHTHIATEAEGREAGLSLEQYLRRSITEPSAFTSPGWEESAELMESTLAAVELSSSDIDALVAFLLTQE
jgi:mono/diheme cytochrome c family protein